MRCRLTISTKSWTGLISKIRLHNKKKLATIKENALKNAKNFQKTNFWAKVIMQYFQKYARYEWKVFVGSKDSHPMGSLWNDYQIPNPPNYDPPHAFSQQLPILAFFLAIFSYSLSQERKVVTNVTNWVTSTIKNVEHRSVYAPSVRRDSSQIIGSHMTRKSISESRIQVFWCLLTL